MLSKSLSFNEDAKLYDRMRPGYPRGLFTEIQKTAAITEASRMLEVGCGSGQATRELVKLTQHITCVDPGENLLAIAQTKFPDLTFVNTSFESYRAGELYDIIVSATAWHWVDPNIGYKKAYQLLKPDGYLAILHNHHLETDPEAFHNKADFIYRRYSSQSPKPDSRQLMADQASDLENEYFRLVRTIERKWQRTYSTDEYLALRNTYSDHRTMSHGQRAKLEQELRDFAHRNYSGQITKHYTAVLFLAQKRN